MTKRIGAALFLAFGLATGCGGGGETGSSVQNDTSGKITQQDIDALLARKKPGACLAVRIAAAPTPPPGGTSTLKSFCKQRIPDGASLEDCKAEKKRLEASWPGQWKVVHYAQKHCDDLRAKPKTVNGVLVQPDTTYEESSDASGLEVGVDGPVAPVTPVTPVTPPAAPSAPQSGDLTLPEGGVVL